MIHFSCCFFDFFRVWYYNIRMFNRRFALALIIFLLTLSAAFAKPKKKGVTVPTKVQEKINNTEESPKSWYICELKGKTKAGNVIIGPVEQRELILLVWIANSIQPNKDYCIAKNKTYISKNPEVFFKDEFETIKGDLSEFGVADCYEKYFFTNYLTRSLKLNVDGTPFEGSEDEPTPPTDEEPPQVESSQLTTSIIEEEKNPTPPETKEPEPEPTPEPTPTPAPEPTPEPAPEPVKETKPKIVVEQKQQEIIPEEAAPLIEEQLLPETTDEVASQDNLETLLEPPVEQPEYDNLLFSKLNQEKEPPAPKPEPIPEPVPEPAPVPEPILEPMPEPSPEPEPVPAPAPEPIPEPVPEPVPEPEPNPEPIPEAPVETVTENSFELPISTTPSTTVNRYQRENLLDYAPKKTPPLPSDEDFTSYQLIGSPDQADSKGVTLLMKAAKAGNNWELKNLLNSGANVNLKDSDGWTALMYAVRYQENTSIIDILIDAGAQVKTKNSYNVSALMLASTYNGNPEILRKLLSYYSPSEKEVVQSFVLMLSDNYSSDYSKAAKVDTFIEKSISLNSFYNGKTPLMYAAQYCSSTIVIKKLLDYGAGTSIRSADGKTAFDYAKENPTLPHDDIYWMLNKK